MGVVLLVGRFSPSTQAGLTAHWPSCWVTTLDMAWLGSSQEPTWTLSRLLALLRT